ncbi:MAG: SDR family oxidoreductase, partial [Pseudomonadota bacterium]
LGHALARELVRGGIHTAVTVRGPAPTAPLPAAATLYRNVDARTMEPVANAVGGFRPAAIVNAIGLVKHHSEGADPLAAQEINANFPHRLAAHCKTRGIRLIHLSTDCVFDGTRGLYREDEPISPLDIYGRTKAAGEVVRDGALTLRTSMIGAAGASGRGLLSWFLGVEGKVEGFSRAVFSGPTTLELSRLITSLLTTQPPLRGLFHVAAAPIDKFTLLTMIRDAFGLATPIVRAEDPVINRSLDASRLAAAIGYRPPSWHTMIDELARQWHAARTGPTGSALASGAGGASVAA